MERNGRDTLRRMRVLVVEPDEARRAELVRTLHYHAHAGELEIDGTRSADETLRRFHETHPDLILVSTDDLESGGRDICRTVRELENTRHTGIVFLDSRALGDARLAVECLEMGADDVLRVGVSPAEMMARVRAVLRLKAMTDELRSANHRLSILSFTDELTGLANMRSFNQRFSELVRHCRKGRLGLGVVMLDLDHFKSVNDTTNHLIGSFTISEVGRLIRQANVLGDHDVAARYGGDEFIIGVECEDARGLKAKAEQLRKIIEAASFTRDGCTIRITASFGVACASRGFDGRAEDLIKAADLMLYRSKNLGRNRVSAMHLRYPVDLEKVSFKHLVDDGIAETEAERDAEAEGQRNTKTPING